MNRLLVIGLICGLLLACSSKPKERYDVTTLQSISYALMDLADKKRQDENYPQALLLYQEADKYSARRNDKYLLGLSKLKQAAIYIKTQQLDLANAYIKEVNAIHTYEEPRLGPAVTFLKAEWHAAMHEWEVSKNLYIQLKERFQSDPIRSAYYRIGWWQYERNSMTTEEVAELVARLQSAMDKGELDNVEMYSFVLMRYSLHLLKVNAEGAEAQGLKAVRHFTELEQSKKVEQLYFALAEMFKLGGELDKANYYLAQANRIKNLVQ